MTIHLARIQPVLDAFASLGYPARLIVPISVVELACLVLYLVPRTAVLGAILLTGFLARRGRLRGIVLGNVLQ